MEDLGVGRETILERLRLLPLSPFRTSYAYTNQLEPEALIHLAKNLSATATGPSSRLVVPVKARGRIRIPVGRLPRLISRMKNTAPRENPITPTASSSVARSCAT